VDERYAAFAKALGKEVLSAEPLSRHTSFRIGGPADLFVTAESLDELCEIVTLARELEVPYFLLGGGTNILVSDRGIRGLVIANKARGRRFEGRILYAESGALLGRLARQAVRHSLSGLEWAVGIPGTIGGAVVGNAGAYGASMADAVRQITVLDESNRRRDMAVGELGSGYRTSRLRGRKVVVLSAELGLNWHPRRHLETVVAIRTARRKMTQPSLPSAGSVFLNPPGGFAGRLIEAAGLKGHRIGQACISEVHANFIVNLGGARADEVRLLIELIQQTVWELFQVQLELEIELVGQW
jgi:UDP-N-acetylmuramate dehydrogenase